MYRRILLAYDGSRDGRNALREGALMAKWCGADIYLLSVVAETPGVRMSEGAYAGAIASNEASYRAICEEGVQHLKRLGLAVKGKLVWGEPAREISAYAREIGADLVVVGHRRQNFFARWWSGSTGATLTDQVDCSILISHNVIADEDFQREFHAGETAASS